MLCQQAKRSQACQQGSTSPTKTTKINNTNDGKCTESDEPNALPVTEMRNETTNSVRRAINKFTLCRRQTVNHQRMKTAKKTVKAFTPFVDKTTKDTNEAKGKQVAHPSQTQKIIDEVFRLAESSRKAASRKEILAQAVSTILQDIDSVHWYLVYLEKRRQKAAESLRKLNTEMNEANWKNMLDVSAKVESAGMEGFAQERAEKFNRLTRIGQQSERTEKTMYILWEILHCILGA